MSKSVEHTTFRNDKLFCLNCGGEHALIMPIPIDEMIKKIDAFNALHSECHKTWEQPVLSQDRSIQERALFWIAHGEVGLSSKTMWDCLMGHKVYDINIPYDPDDFSRCYKLLEQLPEWKSHLYKVKKLSDKWSNLVDNWDKLTEMYERNVK